MKHIEAVLEIIGRLKDQYNPKSDSASPAGYEAHIKVQALEEAEAEVRKLRDDEIIKKVAGAMHIFPKPPFEGMAIQGELIGRRPYLDFIKKQAGPPEQCFILFHDGHTHKIRIKTGPIRWPRNCKSKLPKQ